MSTAAAVALGWWVVIQLLAPAHSQAEAGATTTSTDPETIAALPRELSPEMKKFGLVIDKIDVFAPVIQDVDGTNKALYNQKLKQGLAHYKGTALPGAGGNIFIFGHSSATSPTGPYTQVFARLNELEKGDGTTVYFQDKEYRYVVSDKKIVSNLDISVLEPTSEETLTLMTCWPIGSNLKRLVVILKPA